MQQTLGEPLAERSDQDPSPSLQAAPCQADNNADVPTDAASDNAQQAGVSADAATLPVLPLDVLEAICMPLDLKDRICLASCCAALWRRADVTGSAALWGSLLIQKSLQAASGRDSLRTWLGRHRAALRRLHLPGLAASPAPLLGCLEGGGIAELSLEGSHAVGRDCDAVLGALRHLPALQWLDLRGCGLRAVPSQLSALPPLSSLGLASNGGLGQAHEAAWQPLQGLSALTGLDLGGCDLERLPGQLSALGALCQLGLASNMLLGKGGKRAFEPLGHLPGLTRLGLESCCLGVLPSQLPAVGGLARLELRGNPSLGAGGDAALAALRHLHALTSLDLRSCGLQRLPPGMSALRGLVELRLGSNELSQEQGPGAFGPLGHLGALTLLDMSGCRLTRLPPSLALLTRVADLDVGGNPLPSLRSGAGSEEGGGGWAPLRYLGGLTRLDARGCGLRCLPPEVLSLRSLVDLNLGGSKGEVLCLELHQLVPAWTRLDLSECVLSQIPPQLSALAPSLRDLSLARNVLLGRAGSDGVFEPLRHLTRLVRLDLRLCQLEGAPPQLSALRTLRELRLGWNVGLGRRGEATWLLLLGLPALEHVDLTHCGLKSVPLELAAKRVHVKL